MDKTTLTNLLRLPTIPTIEVEHCKVSIGGQVIGDLYVEDDGEWIFDVTLEDCIKSFVVTDLHHTSEGIVKIILLRHFL